MVSNVQCLLVLQLKYIFIGKPLFLNYCSHPIYGVRSDNKYCQSITRVCWFPIPTTLKIGQNNFACLFGVEMAIELPFYFVRMGILHSFAYHTPSIVLHTYLIVRWLRWIIVGIGRSRIWSCIEEQPMHSIDLNNHVPVYLCCYQYNGIKIILRWKHFSHTERLIYHCKCRPSIFRDSILNQYIYFEYCCFTWVIQFITTSNFKEMFLKIVMTTYSLVQRYLLVRLRRVPKRFCQRIDLISIYSIVIPKEPYHKDHPLQRHNWTFVTPWLENKQKNEQ